MASTLDHIQKLRARRFDPVTGQTVLADSRLAKSLPGTVQDARDYIVESMQPLPLEYTLNTFAESERVQNQILKVIQRERPDLCIEFEYQGSVTNNTHIRLYSDIDVLVVPGWFFCVQPPLQVQTPYRGDPVGELLWLRQLFEAHLAATFWAAQVDGEGAKAISLSGGSLRRKIDVVPANWLDTVEFRQTNAKEHRGVMVLDAKARTRIVNFPFMHNHLVDIKDGQTRGALRAAIRFLKNIKADEEIPISSYDVASLCYAAPNQRLLDAWVGGGPIVLAYEITVFASELLGNEFAQSTLMVPNKTRRLFGSDGIGLPALQTLVREATAALRAATLRQ